MGPNQCICPEFRNMKIDINIVHLLQIKMRGSGISTRRGLHQKLHFLTPLTQADLRS